MITPDGFVVIFADHDGDRYVDLLSPSFPRESTMPRNDPAEVLAMTNVQHAIGDLIQQVARESGIADRHSARMRIQIVDRLSSGSPVDPATALVVAIQESSWAPPKGKDPAPWQDDTRKLLLALGLGDHARPRSCHDVIVGEILPAINALVARAARVPEGGETGRTLERNKGVGGPDFKHGGGIGRD